MRTPHYSRRIGAAVVIAGLHAAAIIALLALRPPAAPRQEAPPLTIVTLPRLQELGPAPNADAAPTPPRAITAPFPTPALPALPPLTAPSPDPGVAALGEYLGCRMPGQKSTAEKERCDGILRALPATPPRDAPQTEQEKALARKFDHDQKALESPLAVPCLMGGMISPLCVAATLLTGGDWVQTYADAPERPREPLPTGMVGRSGRPPGYP